jgi:5-methylcytosine-specific restriction protein A
LQPCAVHPPRQRWDNSTRKQRRQGTGWEEQARHKRIMRRDGGRCYLCAGPAQEVDHVTPLAQGGTDRADNLRAVCKPCHAAKTALEGRP